MLRAVGTGAFVAYARGPMAKTSRVEATTYYENKFSLMINMYIWTSQRHQVDVQIESNNQIDHTEFQIPDQLSAKE